MNPEIPFRLGQSEQQLNLMRELAEVLALALAALLAGDIEKLQLQTERQRLLCLTLLTLSPDESNARSSADEFETSQRPGFASDDFSPPSSRQSSQELRKLGLQVKHLNLVQAALLRRARRTHEILVRLQASRAPTYPVPGAERNPLTP